MHGEAFAGQAGSLLRLSSSGTSATLVTKGFQFAIRDYSTESALIAPYVKGTQVPERCRARRRLIGKNELQSCEETPPINC